MQFSYDTRLTDYGFEMVPRVPVIFTNPKTGMNIPLFCLVDSGATDVLIHRQAAELIGINPESGEKRLYGGVGGDVVGYKHSVKIRLADDRHEFTIECAVLDLPYYEGLLGQNGFFDNYKVIFEKYINRIELRPRIRSKR